METLVVVPTYNEAQNIGALAAQLFALHLPDLHLLVVDDNSPDGTADIADALNAEYNGHIHVLRRASKEGLGPAYVAGFRQALQLGARQIVQMDADLSHPPEYVPGLVQSLEDCDVAVGSRYIEHGGINEGWSVPRRLLSQGGDWYVRIVLGLRIHDTKSGFKAFRRCVLENLDLESLKSKGFIFQAEVLYHCQRLGYRIHEMPFIFHERKAGKSKMSLSIVLEALWRSAALRWEYRRSKHTGAP